VGRTKQQDLKKKSSGQLQDKFQKFWQWQGLQAKNAKLPFMYIPGECFLLCVLNLCVCSCIRIAAWSAV